MFPGMVIASQQGMAAQAGGLGALLGPGAIATSVLGGLFGAIGQRSQRKAAERYAANVAAAARSDALQQFASLGRRKSDVAQMGAQQVANIMRQGTLEVGQVQAAAGAAGVTGNSYEALRSSFEKQTVTRMLSSVLDTETEIENITGQSRQVAAQANSRIAQAYSQVPQKANLFGQLFQIGSDAFMTSRAFQ